MRRLLPLVFVLWAGCASLERNALRTFDALRSAADVTQELTQLYCGDGGIVPATKCRGGDKAACQTFEVCETAVKSARSALAVSKVGLLTLKTAKGADKDAKIQRAIDGAVKAGSDLEQVLRYWGVEL